MLSFEILSCKTIDEMANLYKHQTNNSPYIESFYDYTLRNYPDVIERILLSNDNKPSVHDLEIINCISSYSQTLQHHKRIIEIYKNRKVK